MDDQNRKSSGKGIIDLITRDELLKLISESHSILSLLKNIGIASNSLNKNKLVQKFEQENIDYNQLKLDYYNNKMISGFFKRKLKKIEDNLKENHYITWSMDKKLSLVKLGYFEYKCKECQIGNTWNNLPLTLQMDHINGDNKDNRLENLRLLCPNCHSQTSTFGSKNLKQKLKTCPRCHITDKKLSYLGICYNCQLIEAKNKILLDFASNNEFESYLKNTNKIEICKKYHISEPVLRELMYTHFKCLDQPKIDNIDFFIKKSISIKLNKNEYHKLFFSIKLLIDNNLNHENILKILEISNIEYNNIMSNEYKEYVSSKKHMPLMNISHFLIFKKLKELESMEATAIFFHCSSNAIKKLIKKYYPDFNFRQLKYSNRPRIKYN